MPGKRMFVGFDLGNEKHALCVVDEDGKVIVERTVQNDWGALAALLPAMSKVGVDDASAVDVAIEDRHCALVDALVAHGFRVFTINPKQVDRFRDRFTVAGAKDDRRDAFVLASTLRSDGALYRAVTVLDDTTIALRSLAASIDAVDEDFRRSANQLRALVLRCWPALLSLCAGADEPWFWELIVEAMTVPVDDDRLGELLKKHKKRRLTVKHLRAVLDAKRLPISASVATSNFREMTRTIERLVLLRAQRRTTVVERAHLLDGAKSKDKAKPSDVDILLSAPGCGPQTTTTLMTTILPALKSKDGLGLARAVAGVAPVTRRSGKSELVAMRYACNAKLRNALHHAAAAAALWDPKFKSRYQSLRAAGHSHGRALRSIGDGLLKLLTSMLRARTLYRDPTST